MKTHADENEKKSGFCGACGRRVFLGAELALTLAGAKIRALLNLPEEKEPTSPIEFQQLPPFPVHLNAGDRRVELQIHRAKRDNYIVPRPEGTIRVILFGGSATYGLGFPFNGSFGTWLERMLLASYPGRTIEVINMAGVGFASAQVRELAVEAIEKADPSLVVVYSGNNELLDKKAQRAMEEARGVRGTRITETVLGRVHLVRFLAAFMPSGRRVAEHERNILTSYLGIKPNEREIRDATKRYRDNLRAVARAAKSNDVPLILCTLIANPVFDMWIDMFFDEALAGDPNGRNVYQAAGWARLGRWDLAERALEPIARLGPRLGLLRVHEAAGIRGRDSLGEDARASLTALAPRLVDEFIAKENRTNADRYVLAHAYALLDRKQELRAILNETREDNHLSDEPMETTVRQVAVSFAQFEDHAAYHAAYRHFWDEDPLRIVTSPRVQRCRPAGRGGRGRHAGRYRTRARRLDLPDAVSLPARLLPLQH
ncbi:MAG: SGNH/GDSL hydrolase family protein [Deltaproteobacteria bacterium]|nr:SGNH/GDSL hydrolase family protein [Deltaproteobacteria bacterium]